MIRRTVLAALIAGLVSNAIPHQRLEARNPRAATSQPSKMYETPGPPHPDRVVAHAKSVLLRNDSGIAMQIHTRGLAPGHAYTVWWVIFNNPGQGPPAVLYATGNVVGRNGIGNFAASRRVGDKRGTLNGGVLVNPRGAEVHLVVKDHGMMDPSRMPMQIHQFEPGGDVQFAVHLPPQ